MADIILARLDLYRHSASVLLNDKIQLALLLAVEVVELKPMGRKLLCSEILEDPAEVYAGIIVQHPELQPVSVL